MAGSMRPCLLWLCLLAPFIVGLTIVYPQQSSPAENSIPPRSSKPNIVLILTDDLGFGDLGIYGGLVPTPNVDRLAQEGRLFSDTHSPSSVCTPTRYAILTGREYWRRGKPWNGEYLLADSNVTLPIMLKSFGYQTACIGKWHLGFGVKSPPDWNGPLRPGPRDAGFDYFFGTPRTHNEPPHILIENERILNYDSADPITVDYSVPDPFGAQRGGKAARLKHTELATIQTEKAVNWLVANRNDSFFLYFATSNVHGPLTPAQRFRNTTVCGLYCDYISELDWSVGEILRALDENGLANDTIVIFTSDNGAVLHRHALVSGHRPNGHLLGQKTDVWEGGHRVPFIARWPGRIAASSIVSDLFSLGDLLATIGQLLGRTFDPDSVPDSFPLTGTFLGYSGNEVRPCMTILGIDGIALRAGDWLFIPRVGSGGLSTDRTNRTAFASFPHLWEIGMRNSDFTRDGMLKEGAPSEQLYNLAIDPQQTTNLYNYYPHERQRLSDLLQKIKRGASPKRACVS